MRSVAATKRLICSVALPSAVGWANQAHAQFGVGTPRWWRPPLETEDEAVHVDDLDPVRQWLLVRDRAQGLCGEDRDPIREQAAQRRARKGYQGLSPDLSRLGERIRSTESDCRTICASSPRAIHQLHERLHGCGAERHKRAGDQGLDNAEGAGCAEGLSIVEEVPVVEREAIVEVKPSNKAPQWTNRARQAVKKRATRRAARR